MPATSGTASDHPPASARLATWALGQMLHEAAALGKDQVLIVRAADNAASAKTIERHGDALDATRETQHGPARRYWITVQPTSPY